MTKTLFLSLAPDIQNESGHGIVYQKSLESSVEQLQFTYQGLFPSQAKIQQWQKNWIPFFRRNKILKFIDFLRVFLAKEKRIIFIESFATLDFIYLTLSTLLLSKKDDLICVLFRYESNQLRQKGALHILMAKLCRMKLGSRFVLLTDSELIAEDYKKHLGYEPLVMPIPHADQKDQLATKKEKIICWWPGEPRNAKGLNDILRIALLPDRNQAELVAAKKSNLPNTTLVPDILSREEYLSWLHKSDFILLPYDPIVYRSGTSGIFVEAIIAGKIPLVKKGSWLSFELAKHGLTELILNWENPNIFSEMKALSENPQTLEKLRKMRASYSKFHSQEMFTETLRVALHL